MTIRLKQANRGRSYILEKKRATTNQNQTLHSQEQKIKGHKHKINGNHPTKKKKKGTKEKNRINWKTRFKMATNKYLSIIT